MDENNKKLSKALIFLNSKNYLNRFGLDVISYSDFLIKVIFFYWVSVTFCDFGILNLMISVIIFVNIVERAKSKIILEILDELIVDALDTQKKSNG